MNNRQNTKTGWRNNKFTRMKWVICIAASTSYHTHWQWNIFLTCSWGKHNPCISNSLQICIDATVISCLCVKLFAIVCMLRYSFLPSKWILSYFAILSIFAFFFCSSFFSASLFLALMVHLPGIAITVLCLLYKRY